MPFCIHRFDIYVTLTLPARIGFNFELFFSYRRRFFSTGNSLAVMHVPYIDCLVQKFTTTIVIDEINSLLPEAISNESNDAANISNLGKRPSLVNICCVCLYVMKWNRHPIMNTLSFSFALPLSIFRSLARSLGRSFHSTSVRVWIYHEAKLITRHSMCYMCFIIIANAFIKMSSFALYAYNEWYNGRICIFFSMCAFLYGFADGTLYAILASSMVCATRRL